MTANYLYIVTGTTRGIGRALAQQILARNHMLYSISRAPETREDRNRNYNCDLRHSDRIDAVMRRLANDIPYAACSDIVLINNAGVLDPIGTLDSLARDQMERHVQINLLGPLQLMARFIKDTTAFKGHRRILNISSGAARHPYAGWVLYCSSKAGLDMATRAVMLEQKEQANGVAVSAVAPGVVATDMQKQIRQAGDTDFPERAKFVQMHQSGSLASPDKVAELMLDLDAQGQFDTGGLFDLRDAQRQNGRATIAAR